MRKIVFSLVLSMFAIMMMTGCSLSGIGDSVGTSMYGAMFDEESTGSEAGCETLQSLFAQINYKFTEDEVCNLASENGFYVDTSASNETTDITITDGNDSVTDFVECVQVTYNIDLVMVSAMYTTDTGMVIHYLPDITGEGNGAEYTIYNGSDEELEFASADDAIAYINALDEGDMREFNEEDQLLLDAIDAINGITSIGQISLESKDAIAAVREKVDALPESRLVDIPNLEILTSAEAELEELIEAEEERIAAEKRKEEERIAKEKAEKKAREESKKAEEASKKAEEESKAAEHARDNYTVYLTKTGKCYHFNGCRQLRSKARELTLGQAEKMGYKPCGTCGWW